MKKLLIAACCIISIHAFGQIKVNQNGYVGIGTTSPAYPLHLKSTGNATIGLLNGNGIPWFIGNYNTSPWSAANTLAICNSVGYPKMEFRPNETYIHDKFTVGIGYADNYPVFTIANNKWMCMRANTGSTGILFHESGTYSQNKIQYGGRIEYNATNDNFIIGTAQNDVDLNAINIYRSTGNVGIGQSYSGTLYKLWVNGGIYTSTTLYQASDIRFKENIVTLTNNSEKLKQVRGVTYNTKNNIQIMKEKPQSFNTEERNSTFSAYNSQTNSIDTLSTFPLISDTTSLQQTELHKTNYGFIAQEIQEIYPELVNTDNEGYLAINYIGFIPILVESFKEHQNKIESFELKEKEYLHTISELNNQIKVINSKLEELEYNIDNIENNCCNKKSYNNLKSEQVDIITDNYSIKNSNILGQNFPNPWNSSTKISLTIENTVKSAIFCVYDMTGKQIKCIQVSNRGETEVIINAEELQPGMYLYSLITDGNLIDTKRMVLTE